MQIWQMEKIANESKKHGSYIDITFKLVGVLQSDIGPYQFKSNFGMQETHQTYWSGLNSDLQEDIFTLPWPSKPVIIWKEQGFWRYNYGSWDVKIILDYYVNPWGKNINLTEK